MPTPVCIPGSTPPAQRVWIPAIRQQVKKRLRVSVRCRRVMGKPYPAPLVSSLPAIRNLEAHPFHVTGVAFSGALLVRRADGENAKAYICLFTCAVIRAVHLELVPDLSVDTFLQAFRRFVSRRSLPRILLSDNESTFQAADTEIQQLLQSSAVVDGLAQNSCECRFNPARAP